MVSLFHAPFCPESFASTFNQFCFRLRCRLRVAGEVTLAVACLTGMPLAAQTAAHFSYAATVVAGNTLLSEPGSVAVDSSGDVYIADYGTDTVYKFAPNGSGGYTQQANVADSSVLGAADGAAVDGSGNVYIADSANQAVHKFAPNGSSGYTQLADVAGSSALLYPVSVAVDGGGNVYVADQGNKAVHKFAPNGSGGYNQLGDVADNSVLDVVVNVVVDASGNVYIVDQNNYGNPGDSGHDGVYKFSPNGSGGYIRQPDVTDMSVPEAEALDQSGDVYVSTGHRGSVYKFAPNGSGGYTQQANVAGYPFLSYPRGLAADGSGNVYVADGQAAQVLKLQTAGVNFGSVSASMATQTLTFTFDTSGSIGAPVVVTRGATGLDFSDAKTGTCYTNGTSYAYSANDTCTMVVNFIPQSSGTRQGAVELTNSSGTVIATAYVYGMGTGAQLGFLTSTAIPLADSLNYPFGVAVDGVGNLFVASPSGNTVVEILAAGGYTTVKPLGGSFAFSYPNGLSLDGAGNLFVADSGNGAIEELSASNGYSTVTPIGNGTIRDPVGVAVDPNGNVFVDDFSAMREILAAGGYTTVNTLGVGDFVEPYGIAVDANSNVFVADTYNGAIEEVTAASGYTTKTPVGSGFYLPFAVYVDGNGNIFVGDGGSGTIKEVLAAGGYTTVNTLATGFSQPYSLTVDSAGNIYVADASASVVKELNVGAPPSVNFATLTTVGSQDTADGTQTVTLENIGNQALSLSVPGTGYNPSFPDGFLYDSGSGCRQLDSSSGLPYTLGVNAICTLGIDFLPVADGPAAGNVMLTDNNLGGTNVTQSIPVSGTAKVTPTVRGTAVTQTYGQTASSTITVAGSGATPTGSITYSIDSGTGVTEPLNNGQYVVPIAVLDGGNHTLAVSYSGDDTYNPVSSATVKSWTTATVAVQSMAGTTVTQTYGAATSSTVTLTGISSGVTPTGSITYSIDSGTGVTVSLSDGQYMVPIAAALGGGSHTLAVSYSGDTNYSAISSTQLESWTTAKTTAQGVAGTTVVQTYGTAANSTVTVTATSGGATPTGSITYSIDGGTGVAVALSGGQYVVPLAATLGGGDHTLAASYSGDANYDAVNSATLESWTTAKATVQSAAGTTVVQTYGTATNSTVTVTGVSGGATPTGSITYSVDGGTGVTVSLSGGQFTVPLAATLSGGGHTLAVSYSGDSNYSATSSATVESWTTAKGLVRSVAGTTVTQTYGLAASSTVTATGISGGTTPTGSITYSIDSGTGVTVSLSSGQYVVPLAAALAVGNHTLAVSYSGDGNYNAVSSAIVESWTVSKASSTLNGPATQPVFVVYQQSGMIPVTVAGQYSGEGVSLPGGSVGYAIVDSGSNTVASGSLTVAAGAVSVPVANMLAPGLYTVNLDYAGDGNYTAATAITVRLQVGQIQPVLGWAQPGAISYGATLSGVLNAAATYNSSPVAGTYTYTATPAGGSAGTVTGLSVLAAGSYTLNVSFMPSDPTTYKTAAGQVALTVNQIAPAISLTSSVNPLLVQNTTQLTATVSSSVSTPTGSVTFLDGATALGTVALSSGVATLNVSTLTAATHSITAVYSGDGNFVSVTSTGVSELVQDFSLTISGGSGSQTSATVLPGGVAVYTFTVTPSGGATFPAAVALSVSGLPAGATATLNPTSITAGSGATTLTLTIQTASQTSSVRGGGLNRMMPLALALLLLPFSRKMRRSARRMTRLLAVLLLIVAGGTALGGLTGCGSSTGFFGTAPRSYAVTITGTSGALSHATNVTLNVQ